MPQPLQQTAFDCSCDFNLIMSVEYGHAHNEHVPVVPRGCAVVCFHQAQLSLINKRGSTAPLAVRCMGVELALNMPLTVGIPC